MASSSVDMGKKLTSIEAMRLAISEAKKGDGRVSPNPLVGAVVLDKNFQLLGVGFHKKFGESHAEVNAIDGIPPKKLLGAHVFVTLEPCAHVGKTPSCAVMLSALPISSVTYGILDPNPLVAGKGLEILKKAGIEVLKLQELERDCEDLAEVFLVNQTKKRPFVSIKVASSLDGYIALKSGESQWITGPEARSSGHYLRATHDAICTGAGTFLEDNPKLSIRHKDFPNKEHKVVILDKRGDLNKKILSSNIAKANKLENIILVQPCEGSSYEGESKIKIIKVPLNGEFDFKNLLNQLFEMGISSVLVEGGAKTYGQYIDSQFVDRLYCYMAPILIGSKEGVPWTNSLVTKTLANKLELAATKVLPLGNDFLFTAKFKASAKV